MKLIELEPVDFYCQYCDSAMEWTTCQAPMCRGYRCLACGDGCDLYEDPAGGRCVRGLAGMSYALAEEIREERRIGFRYGCRVRTVHLPRECS